MVYFSNQNNIQFYENEKQKKYIQSKIKETKKRINIYYESRERDNENK